jgi:hypothetical protein
MTRYKFTPDKKNGSNKYKGSWSEVVSKAIDLPFTVESIKTVLTWGASPIESPYTHQDIAHWCDRFHMNMFDVDTDKAMDVATGVAADVDAQWDMYLANTYTLEELKTLGFSQERMPAEWFDDWLKQIEKA